MVSSAITVASTGTSRAQREVGTCVAIGAYSMVEWGKCGAVLDAVVEQSTNQVALALTGSPDFLPDQEEALLAFEAEFGLATSDMKDVTSGMVMEVCEALGLGMFVESCDESTAGRLKTFSQRYFPNICPTYSVWTTFRDINCPKTHQVLMEQTKIGITAFWKGLPATIHRLPEIEQYLTDPVCGEALWLFLVQLAQFPPHMLETMDRQTIMKSPLFRYLLEMSSKAAAATAAAAAATAAAAKGGGSMCTPHSKRGRPKDPPLKRKNVPCHNNNNNNINNNNDDDNDPLLNKCKNIAPYHHGKLCP